MESCINELVYTQVDNSIIFHGYEIHIGQREKDL